jgi:hypothetical protein
MHLPLLDLLRSLPSFTALDILLVKLISSSFFAPTFFFFLFFPVRPLIARSPRYPFFLDSLRVLYSYC